jgi:hypothetical protein
MMLNTNAALRDFVDGPPGLLGARQEWTTSWNALLPKSESMPRVTFRECRSLGWRRTWTPIQFSQSLHERRCAPHQSAQQKFRESLPPPPSPILSQTKLLITHEFIIVAHFG